jgi:hypothetical protein
MKNEFSNSFFLGDFNPETQGLSSASISAILRKTLDGQMSKNQCSEALSGYRILHAKGKSK